MHSLSHKKVKVYSIVEEEVVVPYSDSTILWRQIEGMGSLPKETKFEDLIDKPDNQLGYMHTHQEPIHRFCERFCKVPRHHPDYPHKDYIEGLWETKDTYVSFKHSDKDGFMKYLTLLIDGAKREKQYEVDRKQAQIEKLEGQLYRTQVNLEHLDSNVNNATFWKRLKYLFGGKL